ncbi:MAG: SRPBCC family protein [Acidimicrobiales bacterium]
MRYTDGPTVEVEVSVAAPLAAVWALVSDIDVPARFSNELVEAEWVDVPAGPAAGARFVGRNAHAAIGSWETTSVVVQFEPGRVFGWEVQGDGGTSAAWRFELEPDGEGTRLRQWARMGPARSGLSAAIDAHPEKEERIVGRRLEEWERNMRATVEGIKALAEGAPA